MIIQSSVNQNRFLYHIKDLVHHLLYAFWFLQLMLLCWHSHWMSEFRAGEGLLSSHLGAHCGIMVQ